MIRTSDASAERTILATLLAYPSPGAVGELAETLSAEDFSDVRLADLWRRMLAIEESGSLPDLDALTRDVEGSRPSAERLSVPEVLGMVQAHAIVPESVGGAVRRVLEAAELRRVRDMALGVLQRLDHHADTAAELRSYAEAAILDLGRRRDAGGFREWADVLDRSVGDLRERAEHPERSPALPTGLADLDRRLGGGLRPRELTIIAGRPGSGKSVLGMQIALEAARRGVGVAVYSLEMGAEQLGDRALSSAGRVDGGRMRTGEVGPDDWRRVLEAHEGMRDLPIWVDDATGRTITSIRSQARRLKAQRPDLGMVVVDYMQLAHATGGAKQSREQAVSEVARGLYEMGKDLDVRVVALAQLNRQLESRSCKRPMMSDLRECLPATALVCNAETGERVAIGDIAARGLRFDVWATDEHLKLVRRPIVDAWSVGRKEVFRLTARSGRVLECTAGHRLRTLSGWVEVQDLRVGDYIAVPRRYAEPRACEVAMREDAALLLGWLIGNAHLGGSPTLTITTKDDAPLATRLGEGFGLKPSVKPERLSKTAHRVIFTTGSMTGAKKNPLTRWLRDLGVWRLTAGQKHVPEDVFRQSDEVAAAFLRGLFHADGTLTASTNYGRVVVKLATISERLARDTQHLLLRLGICSTVTRHAGKIGGYRTKTTTIWGVAIQNREGVETFMSKVGFLNLKHEMAVAKLRPKENDAGRVDRIPNEVNAYVTARRTEAGLSHADLGWREQGRAMSRQTCGRVAARLEDPWLMALATSDLMWDEVASIEPVGEHEVFDLTVAGLHNFCVDGFVTHNSGEIEQAANTALFLYRDELYNENSADKGVAEIIIGKQRAGQTGTVKAAFRGDVSRFDNLADTGPEPTPRQAYRGREYHTAWEERE